MVAEDCGQIINPMIVDGQVHGGIAQGIGAALFEELVYDEDSQLLTASLADYVIPAAGEVPPIGIVHLEADRLRRWLQGHGRGRHDRRAGRHRERARGCARALDVESIDCP